MLTLFVWSPFSFALNNCIGKNKTIAPSPKTYTDSGGNVQDTAPWTAWKALYPITTTPPPTTNLDWRDRQNWGCCANLILNATTKVCEDPSMSDDSSYAKCTGHSDCSNIEYGCFNMREDDMFHTDSEDQAVIDAMAAKEIEFDAQQDTLTSDPKGPGLACIRDMECTTNKCGEDFRCSENKICRMAGKDSDGNFETAPGNIKCEYPLGKGADNKCGDACQNCFSGLLGTIAVEPIAATQCQFKLTSSVVGLDEKYIKKHAKLAVVTARSMEWLFATASSANHHDCLYTMEFLRDTTKNIVEQRREILKNFNTKYLAMEAKFKLINESVEGDQTPITTYCSSVPTTRSIVAQRKATGYDTLCNMFYRNTILKEYEEAMKLYTDSLLTMSETYADQVFSWSAEDKSWTMGNIRYGRESGETVPRNCRSGKKKKIKKRWAQRYKVKGTDNNNKSVIDIPGVSEYISLMNPENCAPVSFKQWKYWLLDPLLPGGYNQNVSFGNYGHGGDGDSTDRRRKLSGDDGYNEIYDGFKPRINAFYASLPKDIAADQFIYEPEILSSYEERGCLGKIDDPSCANLKSFLGSVQDTAFAQMIAYSAHAGKRYKYYFLSPQTWRRKLFRRLKVDLTNLREYYPASVTLRTEQNICLDRVIKYIEQDFNTTTTTAGAASGAASGATSGTLQSNNYYGSGGLNSLPNAGGNQSAFNPTSGNNNVNSNNNGLGGSNNVAYNASSLMTNGLSGSNGNLSGISGAGSISSISDGKQAARIKEMLKENKSAMAKGTDLAKMEQEFRKSLGNSSILRGGGGGPSSNSSNSSSGTKNSLDKEVVVKGDSQNKPNGADANSAGGNGGSNNPNYGAYGSSDGSNSSSQAGKRDSTGLSADEQQTILNEVERNKKKLKSDEYSSLFEIISNGYKRNLFNVFGSKKEID